MTYWATLWYAGSAVFSIGFEGQTLQQCQDLAELMLADINQTYKYEHQLMVDTMFPENKFKATCQAEFIEPDTKYAEEISSE